MGQLDWYLRGDLKPRQLQLMVALDEVRNISKAAAQANVTQPAISKALGDLERGLGVKLFERSARGLHPTVYGECLIRHARILLDQLASTRDELRGLVTGASGRVAIGALSSTVNTLLPQSLALLRQQLPGTSVLVRENTQEALLPELLSGKLDLLIGRLPGSRLITGLAEKILFKQPVSVVCGRRNRLARKPQLRWEQLRDCPWVLPPEGTVLRKPVEQAFLQHGIPVPGNALETISANVIARYVELTDAVGVMASDVAAYYHDLGVVEILPVQFSAEVSPIGVVWNSARPVSPSATAMMQCLETVAATIANVRQENGAHRIPLRKTAALRKRANRRPDTRAT